MTTAQMNEILGVLGLDFALDDDLQNDVWMNVAFENPDFPENSDQEILIPDAFVPENIETM